MDDRPLRPKNEPDRSAVGVASNENATGERTVVVAPTYNESDNIREFVSRVRAAHASTHILIVDDNSPDGTGQIADELQRTLGGITVIHRESKEGLGAAYRAGLRHALDEEFDIIVQMDVDLSHDPATLPAMVAALGEGADVVIGSRYVAGGATLNWPLHRRLLSSLGNRYTSFVLGLGVRDATSGFRAYRHAALSSIHPDHTRADGYAFLTELVRRLSRSGARIEEVPIVFVDRVHGSSKMSGRIVAESMLLVTGWAIRDKIRHLRRRASRRP